jgi:NitT/TauT family transport system permease protein
VPFSREKPFAKITITKFLYPNYWDMAALLFVFSVIILVVWGTRQMASPYQIGQQIPISLAPENLPYYALRSVLRMLIAMVFAVLFTVIFGTWAAKNKHAERIIIPIIDILQSVPVLAFLTITVVGFIALFPGSLLGPECAAIFAIFTSQVWNMALSFYQSLRTLPTELSEAAGMFHLSFWQRFWRLDVPFAMPALLWNMMVSMSASWFFVVAAESITVANQNISLPGIGSYIALAVLKADRLSVLYAIVAMSVVIILYDQLLFRPLNIWADRFKFEHESEGSVSGAWLIQLFQHTNVLRQGGLLIGKFWDAFVDIPWFLQRHPPSFRKPARWRQLLLTSFWYTTLSIAIIVMAYVFLSFIFNSVHVSECLHVLYLGLLTGTRVMVLIVLCTLVWVPIGVWIGLRPKWADFFQPVIQILAAFPANLFFPIVVIVILKYHLNVEIWTSPLMILGTQWYILFNVVAGVSAIPNDMQQVAKNFSVTGWLWWKKLVLPAIFPYYVTGAITAAGGAWNASIIAEAVSWGSTKIQATGLGAYITQQATVGDLPRLALATAAMSLFVVIINRLVWRPLYHLAEERFRLE